MTQAGLAKISGVNLEVEEGSKPKPKELALPRDLKEALRSNEKAWENFNQLAPSYRRHYIGWIINAKKEETRNKRIRKAIELLARNEKLGMV